MPVHPDSDTSSSIISAHSVRSERKYQLLEIEFKKFDEGVKNWIGFCGQFTKDSDIELEDKYQYPIQATQPGTEPSV